jgi:uncharacterized membrane protein
MPHPAATAAATSRARWQHATTMDSLLKTLHIACACLFLGNVIVSGIWAALAERSRDVKIIRFSNRLVLITDLLFTAPGAIGVFVTGHLMADNFNTGGGSPGWLSWSYALFGLSGLVWAVVLLPIQLKQRALLARDGAVTLEYLRLSRLWQVSGLFATALPLPILYLMIAKVA